MAYEAQGVTFDGTNDYLVRAADFDGSADVASWTWAGWVKRTRTGTLEVLGVNNSARYSVRFSSTTDRLEFIGNTSASAGIFDVQTSPITDTDWHHVMMSRNGTATHLYVDDVSDLTTTTDDAGNIDFTRANHAVGASTAGANFFAGDMADIFHAPGQYIDLSVEANRRKFIGPNGGAVDLGSDGSTPTGTPPILFLSGATDTWHTNDGDGGGMTENGALTDAATNPPTEPDAGPPKGSLLLLGVGI